MSFFVPLAPSPAEAGAGAVCEGLSSHDDVAWHPQKPRPNSLPSAEEMCYGSFACGDRTPPAPAYAGTSQGSVQISSAPGMHGAEITQVLGLLRYYFLLLQENQAIPD